MSSRIKRRAAVKSMVAAPCLFTILPSGLARGYSASEKLNVALVGCGTRGRGLMDAPGRIGENLVAMCDVNEQRALMLGNVATLLGREIEYDPIAGVCVGDDEATAALDREHREGWRL